MIATLQAIERHTSAPATRPNAATDADFLRRYRLHLVEQHGRLEPPDSRHPDHYLPLSQLIESCLTCHELVKDEIAQRVGTMVAAADPAVRLNGLRLAVWTPIGTDLFRGSYRPDRTLSGFWHDFTRHNVRTYAPAIVEATAHDRGVWLPALEAGVTTIADLLALHGPIPLFQNHGTVIFDVSYAAYLPWLLFDLTRGRPNAYVPDGDPAHLSSCFASLGCYLMERPDPPWAENPIKWSNFFSGERKDAGSCDYELSEPRFPFRSASSRF